MSVADLYPAEPEDDTGPGRVPPQDVAAEQSVLGAMLLSKNAIDPATDQLQSRDFYRPAHEQIFDTIADLANRGEPADAITVAAELQRRGELARVGGAPYLHTLVSGVPTAANVDYYAEIVHEKAVLRRLVEVGTHIQQIGYDQTGQVTELVDRAQAAVLDVDGRAGGEDYRTVADLMPETVQEIEDIASRDGEMAGVESGFPDLDKYTTGFRPGQMIVVAARPGVGKSTIGLDFVRAASIRQNIPSAIFSLEMTGAEIAMRMLSAEAKVSIAHMRGGSTNKFDWDAISRTMPRVMGAPIVIDDSPNMTMPDIRSKARRIKKQHGLGLVVIDYLQLMTSGKRVENRQVEVSEFSRQIKLLAKELEVPIVAISQLNRGSEQRTDKTPQLSDLRESGSIEQDADMVMLLSRPDMQGGGESDRPGEADIIVAKNRSGPAGVKVAVTFQGHYSRFTPMARDVEPAAGATAAGDFY
ncbi:replicative DNA helicase [Aeromicrobium marinum DSM 15272]|uniref:Replicative DNA helicase n=1 Tax=Aeromicrobium marinum DSM 15272 TaxID=585531 RepID=E2S8L4_9ACTN|nr:replicative DNA helicase [Aeromicrobium marinum]EFQ84519.1 replicative DNA helicase [Aeromicrobium marinum DSM 15272]